MKDKKTGLRKEIILITSIALLIISVTSSGTKLYFSIPSALVCFLCETYGLANRTKNKTYKFIFSVFSPFCFLLLHFWLLYLCKAPSTMMKRAHSSYITYFALTRSASDAERFAACLLYPFVCSFDILLAVVLSAA